MVEDLEGVNKVAIHPHEEAAEWAFYLFIGQGVAALAALIAFRARPLPGWAMVVVVLVLLGYLAVYGPAAGDELTGGMSRADDDKQSGDLDARANGRHPR